MLIHIAPRLFLANHVSQCDLIDLTIDRFGLFLKSGKDLVVRRPYPNKRYLVACRKVGQKAIDGILIDVDERPESFVAIARWAVNADRVITHRVNYVVLDSQFDAVSDDMVLWHAMSPGLGGWGSRWPEVDKDATPANSRPRMDVLPAEESGAKRVGDVRDTRGPNGLIIERTETCRLPTLERERLLSRRVNDRVPDLEMAFVVAAASGRAAPGGGA